MNKEKPFIHLFETQGGKYIFDVNTNAIIKINNETYRMLEDLLEDKNYIGEKFQSYCESNYILKELKEKGFLSSKRVKKVVHPVSDILEDYLQNKMSMIILQVTQQCNLRCDYCPYSGGYVNRSHKNVRMSFETAKKGVEFLLDNSREVDVVNIGFYGGEPLLEFELIKKIIAYAKEISEGKTITFSTTTNGTLFTKEIIEFLMEHDVQISISLDGPKEVHDRNRKFAVTGCGSFDKVNKNLQFFKENYPEYFKKISFNTVLDRKDSFGCINKFFTDYDLIKDSMITSTEMSLQYIKTEENMENEEYDIQLNYELFKIHLARLNRFDNNKTSKLVKGYFDFLKKALLDDRVRSKELSDIEHHGGPCIPGATRLFADVNGNLYPCERVSEESEVMRIGTLDSGFDYDKIRRILNVGQITEKSCTKCWAFRFCTLCAASADELDRLSAGKKKANCASVRFELEEHLKDYCMLNEFGYHFNDTNILQIVEV
ncbi:MAG TPA: Cys-rich peptide radical SAM maturase CcpM [Acetivibrio sp.]|uniref:Cys-rich peptide radical SAM maturase CcpM n=1 Tax=Acetivibrio sp. TaxID=1872092 RepID=UPI002B9D0BCD|nr:Cys-rich peptide radical SAM maturase CcpM [Acetivibrio sp.]HOM03451.1 Cys-rich peptide radical SAM maturase CcpM [Acetivibrio sp.]